MTAIPDPCFGIHWFPNGTQKAQARKVMSCRPFLAQAHQATDSSWGRVENRGLVFLDDAPPPVRSGMGWCPLEQHICGSLHERAVDEVAMSRYPTHIGSTPENIFIFYIEHELGCSVEPDGIAPVNMHHPLWLAGTAAGVLNVEWILTLHWLTGDDNIFGDTLQQVVPVDVTTCFHRDVHAKPSNNDHLFDTGSFSHCLIRNTLEFDQFPCTGYLAHPFKKTTGRARATLLIRCKWMSPQGKMEG